MTGPSGRRLGEILVQQGKTTTEVVEQALARQRHATGEKRLGELCVAQGHITDADLLDALGQQFGLEVLHVMPQGSDTAFADKIPARFLKDHLMVPVVTDASSFLAIHDPTVFQAADDLAQLLELDGPSLLLAPKKEILAAIQAVYEKKQESMEQVVRHVEQIDFATVLLELEEIGDVLDAENEAPVIRMVNLILATAVKAGASDIHIEPFRTTLAIRQRVDGVLYDMPAPPRHVHAPLISRLKIMGRLDITEQRLPQDGRMAITVGDRPIDIRIATLPTSFGERVVLRLLDKSAAMLTLDDLGMTEQQYALFRRLIRSPGGIILVTGPTGSGKTTTLYSALLEINRSEINIITIEDPVEYQLDGIGQIQVNPKAGLTFADGLRSIVRQDPDVILVGEIRDRDTADIAIQAALTGHLVFSTVHTNDAAGAITRLINMGIEPFLVSSSVVAIISQRLVRKVCTFCAEKVPVDWPVLAGIGLDRNTFPHENMVMGTGCPHCFSSGFRGRIGMFETIVLQEHLKGFDLTNRDAGQIKKHAMEHGMTTLEEESRRLVRQGQTTAAEVLRVMRH